MSTFFFKSVTCFWNFLQHSIRNELLRTNLLISYRNSCKNLKLKVLVVLRLSAVYISFPPARLLFYSFTSEELIFIKSSKLVIAHKIKFHAPSARETINFQRKTFCLNFRIELSIYLSSKCVVSEFLGNPNFLLFQFLAMAHKLSSGMIALKRRQGAFMVPLW